MKDEGLDEAKLETKRLIIEYCKSMLRITGYEMYPSYFIGSF